LVIFGRAGGVRLAAVARVDGVLPAASLGLLALFLSGVSCRSFDGCDTCLRKRLF